MIVINTSGIKLLYQFPSGPCLTVRLHELFDPSMRAILASYTARFGQAVVRQADDTPAPPMPARLKGWRQ